MRLPAKLVSHMILPYAQMLIPDARKWLLRMCMYVQHTHNQVDLLLILYARSMVGSYTEDLKKPQNC